jgi:L-amino acid N-acyltransferase YncA
MDKHLHVCLATEADLPRLVEIYNQAISAGNATGDTLPFTVEERLGWFREHVPGQYPVYIYNDDEGQVLGYLSLSPYRGRPAMQGTAEVSYYVDYAHHGQGIASALMERALADCPHLGKHVLLAILLEWNVSSRRLLEKYGFQKWGYLPEVAELNGQLCGHLYFGLILPSIV